MDKRRWAAVIIAVGLLILSIVTSGISAVTTKKDKESEESTLVGLNKLLYGSNDLTEDIIEEGSSSQKIVKLSVQGAIADTGEGSLFSQSEYNHQNFMQQLKQIQEDETVKGVLLQVNSPGGGVYESAEITHELNKIKKLDIPIYTVFENVAASGGYYISANTDKIFASDETTTGSIGVIMSGLNYAGLLEKLGVSDTTYKSGALKDMMSPSRKPTKEDSEVLQTFVMSAYERFVKVVADGRKMDTEKVKKLADGRIYDGSQALENGLIDAIGYPDDALAALKKDKKLKNATVISYSNSTTGFGSSWFGAKLAEWQGLKPTQTERVTRIVEKLGTTEAPKPMYYYGGF
ncbi:signal peptide peptidase SppA [Vagococcus penaei]|uniref:S49 family peptidase n=1 Tax=Vagococcus penaei TaxID=633807 RepID=A0A1Q2D5D5_9ENTE|nr:signal peptide peptidase SppA [Vagococcus penaei]AQP53610.1 S49 family peptidase [Vagococcus penaei]RSU07555.1 signal peptide peptidase SppA [Vagococcus penaei]